MAESASVRLIHPNRDRASAKATKTFITLLLLASAFLIAVVLIGGWVFQAGARWMTAAYIVIYAVIAYYVFFKWRRGPLAVAAGLSIIFASFAAPGLPTYFERVKPGYEVGLLPTELLGLVAVIVVILQVVLAVAAVVGFQQGWQVEIAERDHDDQEYAEDDDYYEGGRDDYEEGDTTEQEPVGAGEGAPPSQTGGDAGTQRTS